MKNLALLGPLLKHPLITPEIEADLIIRISRLNLDADYAGSAGKALRQELASYYIRYIISICLKYKDVRDDRRDVLELFSEAYNRLLSVISEIGLEKGYDPNLACKRFSSFIGRPIIWTLDKNRRSRKTETFLINDLLPEDQVEETYFAIEDDPLESSIEAEVALGVTCAIEESGLNERQRISVDGFLKDETGKVTAQKLGGCTESNVYILRVAAYNKLRPHLKRFNT